MASEELILGFLVAAMLGAAVGLQRQVAKHDVAAGARTFAMYGLWGASAGYLGRLHGSGAFAAALLGFVAVVVAAYLAGVNKGGGRGTTAEAAALVVFGVGVLAMEHEFAVAAALTVGVAALLESKPGMKHLLSRLENEDLRVALQFAIVTAVVLPLVPDRELGPLDAINPHQLWLMVVLVSAIGMAGYASLRLVGQRGLGLTGLLGGLVSSTAVTLGFSRLSKTLPKAMSPIVAGVLGASALMYGRVLLEANVIAPRLARTLAPILILLLVTLGGLALWWFRKPSDASSQDSTMLLENPLTLATALQFGALYGVVVLGATWLKDQASDAGLMLAGAASGVADVDAITLSLANLVNDGLDPNAAARAIMAAVVVNTVVKAGIVLSLGSARLRQLAAYPMLGAAGLGLVGLVLL